MATLIFVCWLPGCAFVDNFAPRVYDGNLGSQLAVNQETLLNIVRASRLQSLNFMAISQVAGNQTEDLKVGLPTITLGPGQTVAQRQFVFGNNIIDSSAQGSFQ